jgi:hypothetical protein
MSSSKSVHEIGLRIRGYAEQKTEWPQTGRHIMAQFDGDSIVVYQAYRHSIARFACENQRFGGDFGYSRMSWIKPNFLWMMFRSGWATKEGQEHILSVRLKRSFFDEVLGAAVASTFGSSGFASHDEWSRALAKSEVRLQWDPDHDPHGNRVERRAIQLGLRGETLRRYGQEEVLSIEDITSFVMEQRQHLDKGLGNLHTPAEKVYQSSLSAAVCAVGGES